MTNLRICIDVDDIDRGIAFYTAAFLLDVGRRFDRLWVELLGANAPIDLLGTVAGSTSSETRREPSRPPATTLSPGGARTTCPSHCSHASFSRRSRRTITCAWIVTVRSIAV